LPSKEVFLYGLTLVGGGISQLVAFPAIYGPLSLYVAYAAAVMVGLGVIIAVLGLYWRWGPRKRPVGITLMAVSFVFVGVASIVLGGWLYTPLFLLAIVSFAAAWLWWTGRGFGSFVIAALAFIGLLASIIGVANDSVVYVPGVLGALYAFWYINRPHVAKYFRVEPFMIAITRKRLAVILLAALLLPLALAYFYMNPPSRTVTSRTGGNGGGSSSSDTYFMNGDTVSFSFQVDAGMSPVEFSIRHDSAPPVILLAQKTGRSGSGSFVVPYTAEYAVWFEPVDTYSELDVEMVVVLTSLRRSIIQWGLLDAYLILLLLSLFWLERKKPTLGEQKPATAEIG